MLTLVISSPVTVLVAGFLFAGFFARFFAGGFLTALRIACPLCIALPGLALVNQLYLAVKSQGHGKLGTQALMLALEQLSQTELRVNSNVAHLHR